MEMENSNQSSNEIQPQFAQQVYYQHSGLGSRVLALLVDVIIILITTFLLNAVIQFGTGQSSNHGEGSMFQLLAILTTFIYSVTLLTIYGATLGKMLLHIKIVNTNYKKASFLQVLLRETIGKILSGIVFGLGYLWVAVDNKKQAWHDKIATTYVINTQPITYDEDTKQQQTSKIGSLPHILIFAGIAEVSFISIFVFSVVSKLTSLYKDFGSSGYNSTTTYLALGLIGLSSLAQIIFGFILWSKKKTPETASKNLLTIAKVLLIIGAILFVLLIPFLVLSIIMPIYNLTSSF